MKKTLIVLLILVISSFVVAQDFFHSGVEIYPAGNPLFYSGTNLGEHFKVNMWATTDSEIAFTIGPKIGILFTGMGISIGNPDGVDIMYHNADLAFGLDIGHIHWQSYNLYQWGQGGQGDFVQLRQWISHKKRNLGLVGHNIKINNESFNFFWGPYYDFGSIANSTANKFCVAIDLANNNGFWAAWIIEL